MVAVLAPLPEPAALLTTPGVQAVTAATFIGAVGDVRAYESSRQTTSSGRWPLLTLPSRVAKHHRATRATRTAARDARRCATASGWTVGGELRDGRAMPETREGKARALISVNDKTLNDWHAELEKILGITHVDGRAQYGWRRAFVNMYDGWTGSDRVKNLITGHTKLGPMTHGSTRDEVYLDPADVPLLREGQRLVEHARTEYVRTGEAPSELERHFPARSGSR